MTKRNSILVLLLLLFTGCSADPTLVFPSPSKPTSTSVIKTQKPTSTQVIFTGCVKTGSLRVRSSPGTQSEILGGLAEDTCISIIGRDMSSGWVLVSSDEFSGWVSSEYMDIAGDITALPIIADTVRFSNVPTAKPKPTTPVVKKTNTPLPEYILCKDTSNLIGSHVTCKIPRAYCSYEPSTSGKPTFCNDARYPNHNFTLLVWGSDWSFLNGSCILVSGRVTSYQGKPQIEASSEAQVSYCP